MTVLRRVRYCLLAVFFALVAEGVGGPAGGVDHAHERAQGGVVGQGIEAGIGHAPVQQALGHVGQEGVGDGLRGRGAHV